MATILDVARQAGVSKTLVSRYLNNQVGVSEDSAKKIAAAIEALAYRPNMAARSLVLQRTQTIGVVMDSLRVPYYFEVIRGLETAAGQNGYRILFCSGNADPGSKDSYINYLTSGSADGIVIYGSLLADEKVIRSLVQTDFPFVLMENEIPGLALNNITLDNHYGASLAVQHLVDEGCRDILHFMGNMNTKVSLDRFNGYVDTMRKAGLPITNRNLVQADFTEQSGYESMQQVLRAGALPDGIFFAGDITAFGAMRALLEAGVSIPGDIRLVGFDEDKPESFDIVFPALTTVRQPLYEMGKTAIHMLVNAMENPAADKQRRCFKPSLIKKATT